MKTQSLTPASTQRVNACSPISAAASVARKFFTSKSIGAILLSLALAALLVNAATGRYTAIMAATVTAWALHMAIGAAINIKEGGQK
ncbi:hypothetical protein [Sodaliphilus pleomorphus]|uniref:Uncharacterized protein n=1 Tax=Sodaliphilus pleomorphus TaxID=2606626 RepID=A0A6L5XGX3_9BACT|nr:hypothetical protein [Sodaliphilus pleomorphus]MSS18678.1 hypothetical protein [Sodaliphilus pleomorphus]